jgi:lipid II isoglutaminyl synthase (glutamine-hydrolysing)
VTGMRITLGYLYPDLMSTYGDRGNVVTIVRRCEWRGITADVRELRLGDRVEPGRLDLIVIGSGGESQQRLIASDLHEIKGPGVCEAVADGAAALAVGGGYELFGRFCQPGDGAELPGAGVFDAWTIGLSDRHGTLAEVRADRAIGDLIVRSGEKLLVGFENHSGGTYLGPTATPLGEVVCGHGNNGDGSEGVLLGNAVGTHMRGPCLPKNPALADFLIGAAVARRHCDAELPPLADELESAAREAAMQRVWQAMRSSRRGSRVRSVLRRLGWGRPLDRRSGLDDRPARPGQAGQANDLAAADDGAGPRPTGCP